MSDGKEVKDADRGPHETWCDTQNNISERCNCMASSYIDRLESYETTIAELRSEVEKLRHDCGNHNISQADIDWCVLCDRESNEATIARKAKVIENLKGMVSHYETCATVDRYDDEEVPCDCGLEKELAAIEKEGEK